MVKFIFLAEIVGMRCHNPGASAGALGLPKLGLFSGVFSRRTAAGLDFNWSPSRVLSDFLIYREVDAPLTHVTKKTKKAVKQMNLSKGPRRESCETHLYGSFVDSYNFKDDGLVKKTVTATVGPSTMRLVSYYRGADVLEGRLQTPSGDPSLRWMMPRRELWSSGDGRLQRLEGSGLYVSSSFAHHHNARAQMPNAQDRTQQGWLSYTVVPHSMPPSFPP